jgi:hypothetical protein
MAVPKQSTINRIKKQREFFKKKREDKKEDIISEEEHKTRLEKLIKLGLIK